jgi:predicted aminopeptidase
MTRARLTAALAAAGCVVLPLAGCGQFGYYAQAVGGHVDLMRRARPVPDWLADAGTPEALRERLQLALRMREFAVAELKLPDNRSYRRYADLGRPSAVWNVVAAPELSLALHTWCFPVMGCVGYRGYFGRDDAEAMGGQLRGQGLEVSVYGVPAYSTLGWSEWLGGDPLLNTFIGWSEAELARLIFHELAHQVVYVADDTMFNESFATAVERLGGARWQAATGRTGEDEAAVRRRAEFKALTLRTRSALEALYASGRPESEKHARKAELMAAMRVEHARLKSASWNGFAGYDAWFERANNAALAVQAAYDGLVPQFERLFEHQGRDFDRFYAEVKRLAALPKDERRATLAATH